MKLSTLFGTLAALAAAPLTMATTIPNADTPLFHLVASTSSWTNLLPIRLQSNNGYPGGMATLLGGGTPAQFYFWQGQLVVHNPGASGPGNDSRLRPYINSNQDGTGCPNFGAFGFLSGSSTNKCTKYSTFQIQVNGQYGQLGSELVFNYQGGFYSCAGGQQIYYKDTPSRAPSNCERIHLWTVPVA